MAYIAIRIDLAPDLSLDAAAFLADEARDSVRERVDVDEAFHGCEVRPAELHPD